MPSHLPTPPTPIKLGAMQLYSLRYNILQVMSWPSFEFMSKNSQYPFTGSLLSPHLKHFPYQVPTFQGHQAYPQPAPLWGSHIPEPSTKQLGTASMLQSPVIIQTNLSPRSLQNLADTPTELAIHKLPSTAPACSYPVPKHNLLYGPTMQPSLLWNCK